MWIRIGSDESDGKNGGHCNKSLKTAAKCGISQPKTQQSVIIEENNFDNLHLFQKTRFAIK